MTATETKPRRRGPYKRRARLEVKDEGWKYGDAVLVGRTRWIIRHLSGSKSTPAAERQVVLHSANTINHLIEWRTTLDLLPVKESR